MTREERYKEALQEIDASCPTQFCVDNFEAIAPPDAMKWYRSLANIGDIARKALNEETR